MHSLRKRGDFAGRAKNTPYHSCPQDTRRLKKKNHNWQSRDVRGQCSHNLRKRRRQIRRGRTRAARLQEAMANRDFGIVMRLESCAGPGAGVLTGGVVQQGAGMSSTRSRLVRRVLANSEFGSCTARVKRERSSGVSTAYILSTEAQVDSASRRSRSSLRRHRLSQAGWTNRSSRLSCSKHFRSSNIALRSVADVDGSVWMSDASRSQ